MSDWIPQPGWRAVYRGTVVTVSLVSGSDWPLVLSLNYPVGSIVAKFRRDELEPALFPCAMANEGVNQ